jgi:sigma-B regulation protein RsbU (phosphoserine phosphatase)
MEDDEENERTVNFESGDILIMYTDGIIERKNADKEIYGRKRLLDLLQQFSGQSVEQSSLVEIINIIESDIHDFSGSTRTEDDITLLAVKRS